MVLRGTVCENRGYVIWVQLDDDCKVMLIQHEFIRLGISSAIGTRVNVAVGDIHSYLVGDPPRKIPLTGDGIRAIFRNGL